MSRKSIIIIASFFLFLTGVTVAIALYEPPIHDKPLTLLISREPDTLTFLTSKQGISLIMQKALFRGLVGRDDKLKLFPELAVEIPTPENGLVKIRKDGKMEVHWQLKKGLKWSDGHPLTAEDVLFTYNLLKHPDLLIIGLEKQDAKAIESINISKDISKGKLAFVVLWKTPYPHYLEAHPILPKHILEKPMKENPKKFQNLPYHRFPIGNGPYKIVKWEPGSYLLFEANPNALKKPKIKTIAFKIVKDVNSLLVNLISRSGDMCSKISPEQYHFLTQNYKKQLQVYNKKGMGWIHIDLDLNHPILKDKRVRQALLYGINRKAIVDAISHNTFEVADSWLPFKHYGHHSPKKQYSYNPDKAKQLLALSGWKKNNKGVLEKNGTPLVLELITDSTDRNRIRFASFIQEDLKKLGIQIKIQTYPSRTLMSKYIFKSKFQMALYKWTMIPRIDGEVYWASYKIPGSNGKNTGLNFTGLKNTEIDSIHKSLSKTLLQKKRLELFKKHQDIWIEELPSLPLFITRSISATRKDLLNWKPTGSAIPETWNCEEWMLRSDK